VSVEAHREIGPAEHEAAFSIVQERFELVRPRRREHEVLIEVAIEVLHGDRGGAAPRGGELHARSESQCRREVYGILDAVPVAVLGAD
jgi:hypothetical protein